MATYSVLPTPLDIAFVRGDEFGMSLDFGVDLTGYTFSTSIYEVTAVTNGLAQAGNAVASFTIVNTSLALGKLNLSLQENQTSALNITKAHRWYMRWVAPGVVTRTVISGSVTFGDP